MPSYRNITADIEIIKIYETSPSHQGEVCVTKSCKDRKSKKLSLKVKDFNIVNSKLLQIFELEN